MRVPETLVNILKTETERKAGSDRENLVPLLKSLNNLSASSEKDIRDSLAVGIADLIQLVSLGNSPNKDLSAPNSKDKDKIQINNSILEYSLRTLMNLAVDVENEDRIRENNGIPPVIALLRDSDTDVSVLLQTARLLINLVFNDQNKAVIVKEEGIQRVSELTKHYFAAWKEDSSDNEEHQMLEELVTKLARLLGLLSQYSDLSVELYQVIVDETIATAFVDLLEHKKHNEKEAGYLLSSLSMILKKAKSDLNRYGSVINGKGEEASFVDTLAAKLPDLLIIYMRSSQKNTPNHAESLLKSLCELKGSITDDVLEKLSKAGLHPIAI